MTSHPTYQDQIFAIGWATIYVTSQSILSAQMIEIKIWQLHEWSYTIFKGPFPITTHSCENA